MATTSKKNVPASKKKTVKKTVSAKLPAANQRKDKSSSIAQAEKAVKPSSARATKQSGREKLIQDIRKQLLEQKAALMAGAEATRTGLPDDETYPDLGDQATAESDRSFLLRLRSRESKLIKKIDDTIELIDKGEYGICEECGEEIDERRLIARPVTTFCIECKTRQEEDEKLR